MTITRGIVKKAKSISFARMDETELNGLYKSVFNVAWRHMLQASFASEAEAMAAADSLGELAHELAAIQSDPRVAKALVDRYSKPRH